MKCWRPWTVALAALGILLTASSHSRAQTEDMQSVLKMRNQAVRYLRSAQKNDGSFAPKLAGPGVSALVAAALLRNGISAADPLVAKTLKYLESQVKKDGGVYDKFLANYTTSVAVMAFHEANTDGKYDTVLKNAAKFLKQLQHDEPESTSEDVDYGGFGYDKKSRPDLSNSSFSIEALHAAGVEKDDPALQKALKFLSRCQNLPGETNDQPFAQKTSADDKGGFVYNPTNVNKNPEKTAAGGLRSVGSMTYAGLKSFLYAGVGKDDPRVKAALDWIGRHYTLKENPGQGQTGLFYYYHTFAKAMDALGQDAFTDADGKKHHWRQDLLQTLKAAQQEDGSWVNRNDRRYGEASPELATAFALLSLSYCTPK